MQLELVRDWMSKESTAGKLFVEGVFECFTLERPDYFGLISPGRYEVRPHQSPRFAMRVPVLVGVPGRDWIEIHPGNTVRDTHGCILVGVDRLANAIARSRVAFTRLMPKLEAAWKNGGPVWLEIRNEPGGTGAQAA